MTIIDAMPLLGPHGRIRAAINLGNPLLAWRLSDGGLDGPSVRIAREIAEILGVGLSLIAVEYARHSFELLRDGDADVGFLAIDPLRAEHLAFSDPYVTIHGGFLVPDGSSLQTAEDVDQASIRIAASRGSAYGLHLQRAITSATIVETASFEERLTLLRRGEVDVAAGITEAFPQDATGAWRTLEGTFLQIRQAVCVRTERAAAIAFLNDCLSARPTVSNEMHQNKA